MNAYNLILEADDDREIFSLFYECFLQQGFCVSAAADGNWASFHAIEDY